MTLANVFAATASSRGLTVSGLDGVKELAGPARASGEVTAGTVPRSILGRLPLLEMSVPNEWEGSKVASWFKTASATRLGGGDIGRCKDGDVSDCGEASGFDAGLGTSTSSDSEFDKPKGGRGV